MKDATQSDVVLWVLAADVLPHGAHTLEEAMQVAGRWQDEGRKGVYIAIPPADVRDVVRSPMIGWRELLKKYIQHITANESVSYLEDWRRGYPERGPITVMFSDEEWSVLEQLDAEVDEFVQGVYAERRAKNPGPVIIDGRPHPE